jgi:hypothetical protein
MKNRVSRRRFLGYATAAAVILSEIESVVNPYHSMFGTCDVPGRTRKMIMCGTLAQMLGLPD